MQLVMKRDAMNAKQMIVLIIGYCCDGTAPDYYIVFVYDTLPLGIYSHIYAHQI
jgi:hypothetical protein